MKLLPHEEHPYGLTNQEFDGIFTKDRPVIFAYHGYPWLIHPLTYRRTNHGGIHVRGYKEAGTTTTPFDMLVKNEMGRFNLIADAAARIARMSAVAGYVRQEMRAKLVEHKEHITRYGEDLPEVRDWKWQL